MILAAVLADGITVLENAAEEPEIDDLINLLNLMGAQIKRVKKRQIVIKGVDRLKSAKYSIMPDRNEAVTFAIGAIASKGDVTVEGAEEEHLRPFLNALDKIGGGWKKVDDKRIRFYYKKSLRPTNIVTSPYPGFMTDWQAPWAILMTQASGRSLIHETIYEDRFGYVSELTKMGANIKPYKPKINNPKKFYNFNWNDRQKDSVHAVKITGPTKLHEAVLEVMDLRAGATLVLAGIVAKGKSTIYGLEHIDRGYEDMEGRLRSLGAIITRIEDSEDG